MNYSNSAFIPQYLATNASIGAAAELFVCGDLLARGLDVFRSLSNNARCDVIASGRSSYKSVRIEVRTGRLNKAGKLIYCPKAKELQGGYDLLAIVLAGGMITYIPDETALLALQSDPVRVPKHPLACTAMALNP